MNSSFFGGNIIFLRMDRLTVPITDDLLKLLDVRDNHQIHPNAEGKKPVSADKVLHLLCHCD